MPFFSFFNNNNNFLQNRVEYFQEIAQNILYFGLGCSSPLEDIKMENTVELLIWTLRMRRSIH